MTGGSVEIVRFRPEYAGAFARLNYEWIEKYFRIEPHDRELLDFPFEAIISKGGDIFFAVLHKTPEPVGTVALIEHGAMEFELAKMAVAPDHQGLGIGKRLMTACIDHARAVGKDHIFLESNTALAPAIALYRQAGFEEVELDPDSFYSRVNIRMQLALSSVRR